MRQEDLCPKYRITEYMNEKRYKCPKCGRRLLICSITAPGRVIIKYIPKHNPKGYKKQKKKT